MRLLATLKISYNHTASLLTLHLLQSFKWEKRWRERRILNKSEKERNALASLSVSQSSKVTGSVTSVKTLCITPTNATTCQPLAFNANSLAYASMQAP